MDKKYYFISYWWKYLGSLVWEPANIMTNEEHPIDFQRSFNNLLKGEKFCVVTSWQKISKEEYDRFQEYMD